MDTFNFKVTHPETGESYHFTYDGEEFIVDGEYYDMDNEAPLVALLYAYLGKVQSDAT